MGKLPPALGYVGDMMTAGLVVTYRDYREMPARTWKDIVLWKEAEAERTRKAEDK
jgi:hypothetical protein